MLRARTGGPGRTNVKGRSPPPGLAVIELDRFMRVVEVELERSRENDTAYAPSSQVCLPSTVGEWAFFFKLIVMRDIMVTYAQDKYKTKLK